MKQALIGLYVIFLIGGIALGAVASVTESEENIIVSKDTFTLFADEPQHHYMRAFENFIKHNWAAAAVEIRKGAAFMKLAAGRAAGDVKSELTASAQMLEKWRMVLKKVRFVHQKTFKTRLPRQNIRLPIITI